MSNSVGGFKTSPANHPDRRGKATRGAQRRRKGRGEDSSPTTASRLPSMNASDTTPPSGECVSGEQFDTSESAVRFFTMVQDLNQDRMCQAVQALQDGDEEAAVAELKRIQSDCEALKELVSDE